MYLPPPAFLEPPKRRSFRRQRAIVAMIMMIVSYVRSRTKVTKEYGTTWRHDYKSRWRAAAMTALAR